MGVMQVLLGHFFMSCFISGCIGGPVDYVFAYNEFEKPEIVGNIEYTKKVNIVEGGKLIVQNEILKETFVYRTAEDIQARDNNKIEASSTKDTLVRDVSDVDKMSLRELVGEMRRIVEATPVEVINGLGYV